MIKNKKKEHTMPLSDVECPECSADVEININLDNVCDFIYEADGEELELILNAIDVTDGTAVQNHVGKTLNTMEDQLKYQILEKAMKKYSLTEIERRLDMDWL